MRILVTSASGASGNGYGAILVFSPEGEFTGPFSSDPRIADPRGMSLDPSGAFVYLNSGEDRVLVLDLRGYVVRDYGRGIPPDQAPLLFNRFVRLPRDLASSTSGNGLGLYLCRLYVEAMGGHIWVRSSGVAGEGSAFHLLLPAADSGVAEGEQSSGPSSLPLPALATGQPVVAAGQ